MQRRQTYDKNQTANRNTEHRPLTSELRATGVYTSTVYVYKRLALNVCAPRGTQLKCARGPRICAPAVQKLRWGGATADCNTQIHTVPVITSQLYLNIFQIDAVDQYKVLAAHSQCWAAVRARGGTLRFATCTSCVRDVVGKKMNVQDAPHRRLGDPCCGAARQPKISLTLTAGGL